MSEMEVEPKPVRKDTRTRPPVRPALGRFLRARRAELDLTLCELAERVGVHNSYLSSVETGRKNPSPEVAQKLVMALDLSPSEAVKMFLLIKLPRKELKIDLAEFPQDYRFALLVFIQHAHRFTHSEWEDALRRVRT